MAKNGANGAKGALSENAIHMILAAKGGIGKTYIGSLFAQYGISKGIPLRPLDLDQSNAMLSRISSLKAEEIDLLSDSRFDAKKMDALMQRVATEPGPFLLDVGASSFQDVWRYLVKYKMLEGLKAEGRQVILHCVIVGGPELPDVLNGFNEVANLANDRQIVVWLNSLRGPIQSGDKTFVDMNVFQKNEAKVIQVVNIPQADEATLEDLYTVGSKRMTLLDADRSAEFPFFARYRLAAYRDQVFQQLDVLWKELADDHRGS